MKYAFFIVMTLILFSCKEKSKDVNQEIKIKTASVKTENIKIPDSIIASSIFSGKTNEGFFRIFVKSKESRGKYFYSDTINVLKAENYIWQDGKFSLSKSVTLDTYEWTYLAIDSINFARKKLDGGKEFLLMEIQPQAMGKAIADAYVNFIAIETDNVENHFNLMYAGYPSPICNGCIKGDFVENRLKRKDKSVIPALYQLAKKSKAIYQSNLKKHKKSVYKNYREKWQSDNQVETNWGAGYEGEMSQIISTYYTENLFALQGDPEENIENDLYTVVSYFRGDVLGYDKAKAKYFPIIVESCSYSCNKSIEFINTHTIKITYEDETSWEVDLEKINFKN